MITLANESHIDDIYKLLCILENQELNWNHFKQCYLNSLNNPDIHYYIYICNNKVVGFLSFYIHHYLHHNSNTGEIVELVVNPEYRNQKIGENLLKFIENLAREKSLEEIELSTSTYSKNAHRFYERNGYLMNHYNYTKKINH